MLVRVEDLCHSCKYFDMGNYECKKGYFLDGESEKFTVECDDYDPNVDLYFNNWDRHEDICDKCMTFMLDQLTNKLED